MYSYRTDVGNLSVPWTASIYSITSGITFLKWLMYFLQVSGVNEAQSDFIPAFYISKIHWLVLITEIVF